jgi:stage III sporulation protein SpoIIIAA
MLIFMVEQREPIHDLELLLATLPPHIQQSLIHSDDDLDNLLEIIMDLGRLPEARYRTHERFLSDMEVTRQDIDTVISRIGIFGEDNRAGIPRTLHRISAIRNRNSDVIGLTCRIGRAIFGTVALIRDIIESGKSTLLLGKPGTGKTTLLRETARVLAEDIRKRVVVVDTSNEIAGDGDIPHAGIGRARRMQVIRPSEQHAVMIEAVENHMPEVIVIDEIGTEREALAARTIAERGVQLIGTAHGNTLDNLLINPTLSDLIGGIQAVTLGDDEARRRGTQKTVLERKAPPTFDVLVEIQGWDQVVVYNDVAQAIDMLLRGGEYQSELRTKNEDGEIQTRVATPRSIQSNHPFLQHRTAKTTNNSMANTMQHTQYTQQTQNGRSSGYGKGKTPGNAGAVQQIFPFGLNRSRLEIAIDHLHVPAVVVRDIREATMVMTLKSYYRRSSQQLRLAETQGMPVYVLRNNTMTQMERQLAHLFHLELEEDTDFKETDASYSQITNDTFSSFGDTRDKGDREHQEHTEGFLDSDLDHSLDDATFDRNESSLKAVMGETELAIVQLIQGERDVVEMAPQNSYVRRLQHQMAERYNLRSKSRGNEPYRRVRIYR